MSTFCFLFVASAVASNPVPTVTAPVHPQAVVPGRGGLTLTVYGANFVTGAVVNWNGSPRSTTFVSARELRAKILASDVVKPTAGCITVTNPAPGGGPSSSSYAIVEVHQPTSTIAPGQPHYDRLVDNLESATAADFNGDGKLDLAFCSSSGNGQIGVLLGNGDGTFKKPVYYHAGNNYSTWAFAAGDFNSDGKTDFIVWYLTTPPEHLHFAILLGNGDGTFQKETSVNLPDDIEDVAMVPGDFSSDGLLDFATLPLAGGIQVYTQK
jgi:hypothetical protein